MELLLSAPSKEQLLAVFDLGFRRRNDGVATAVAAQTAATADWGLDEAQQTQLLLATRDIVKTALRVSASVSTKADVAEVLAPFGLDGQLLGLVGKIVLRRLPAWREAAMQQRVSLPKFVGVDWRVDVQSASEHLSRMSVPTVMVKLQVQEQPSRVGIMPGIRTVNFEMSKEAMDTLLAELSGIKEQLDSVSS